MNRVKCYEKNDLAYHMFDGRVKTIIADFNINSIIDYIEYNQIIELYEANNEYLAEVTSEVIKDIKAKIYCSLNSTNIETAEWINEILKNSHEYTIDDLINFIVSFKIKLLDDDFIEAILTNDNIWFSNIVKVKVFQMYILENILKVIEFNNANLLESLVLEVVCSESLYSTEINEENTYKLIECYINNDFNLNYLPDIFNSKNRKINAKIKVTVIDKYNKSMEEFFRKEGSYSREVEFKILNKKETTKCWIEDNKYFEHWNFDKEILKHGSIYSYESIYKFWLTDFGIFQGNQITIAHYSQDGFKGLGSIAYAGYKTYQSHNHMFRTVQQFQLMRMALFLEYLRLKKINIYKLLNYIIEQILKNGFYAINDSENYDKYSISGINKHLCIQIESLLSQYKCLKKYEIIRNDYISLEASTLDVKQIPSLSSKNYYVKNYIYFNLMNSQSTISMPINNEYNKRLYEQIKNNMITKSVYENLEKYHTSVIDLLIENNVLIWEGEVAAFSKNEQLPYWEHLFQTGAISSSITSCSLLEGMVSNDLLVADTNLMDRFEIEYFNYIFNNQAFNDGLAIRNKYLHTGHVNLSEEEVNLILIKLLLEIIMKMHYTLYSI